jgi:hypothetical protein
MLLKKFAAPFRDKRKPTLPPNPRQSPKNNLATPPQELPVSGLLRRQPHPRLPRRLPPRPPLLLQMFHQP